VADDALSAFYSGSSYAEARRYSLYTKPRIFDAPRRGSQFEAFSKDNDLYSEHDLGAVEIGGEPFLFKIDDADRSLTARSADKADAAATTRVLTVRRADEY